MFSFLKKKKKRKKKKEQKNPELSFSRHIFTYGFFLTKDTEFFLHSAKQLNLLFFKVFMALENKL